MNPLSRLREALWNYPEWIFKKGKRILPFVYIGIAIIFSALVVLIASSESAVYKAAATREKKVIEGVVGAFEYSYPLLPTDNQVNRDLYELLFDKLIVLDVDGNPQSNIAKSWDVSDDGLVYRFQLSDQFKWHDGRQLTADDVKFTFDRIQAIRGSNVQDINLVTATVVSDYEIVFTLTQVNAVFLENISIYILPKHILQSRDNSQIVTLADTDNLIGSGEFKIDSITNDGVNMVATDREMAIRSYEYRTFSSLKQLETAFLNNKLDIVSGLTSSELDFAKGFSNFKAYSFPIYARKKLVFLNNEQLKDKNLRQALNYSVNKEELIKKAHINGRVSDGPYREGFWTYNESAQRYDFNKETAAARFKDAGYTLNSEGDLLDASGSKFQLEITFLDSEENNKLVKTLQEQLAQFGVTLNADPKTLQNISSETLPRRDYQLLIYEIENSVDPDQFNFWHSSNKAHPNLNISQYEYSRVDVLLERARLNLDKDSREDDYELFDRYLMDDAPIVFLYNPSFIVLKSDFLEGVDFTAQNYPEARMRTITDWKFRGE